MSIDGAIIWMGSFAGKISRTTHSYSSSIEDRYQISFKFPPKPKHKEGRDVERAPRKKNLSFRFISFNPLHEIEHKWKQFIVYASSNHPSHPRSHKPRERQYKREETISRSASRASSPKRRKKLNNMKSLLWIALPPKAIANEFLLPFDTLRENWTWFHYVISFCKSQKDASKSQFVAVEKQTKEKKDRVQHDTRSKGHMYLTLWESDECFMIII